MGIKVGVQFLFVKARIYKGFPIYFNDNRLYGDLRMVAVEPVVLYSPIPFNETPVAVSYTHLVWHAGKRVGTC